MNLVSRLVENISIPTPEWSKHIIARCLVNLLEAVVWLDDWNETKTLTNKLAQMA